MSQMQVGLLSVALVTDGKYNANKTTVLSTKLNYGYFEGITKSVVVPFIMPIIIKIIIEKLIDK